MSPADILDKYAEPVAALGYSLRDMVMETLPGCNEEIDIPGNLLGYGFGKGYKNTICTIIASKTMMKLGLNRGSELPDPHKLLKGTGKVHKYIEIKRQADIDDPAVKQMLIAAVDAWKARTDKK